MKHCHQNDTVIIQTEPTNIYRHTCIVCGQFRETQADTWKGKCYGTIKDEGSIIAKKLKEVGLDKPCPHRGELTGETVSGCGCGVPAWRKQIYQCEIHTECVLMRLPKLPSQTNCQNCDQRPTA